MLVFVKLGGSLITDKTQEQAFLADRMKGLAAAFGDALAARPDLRLVIGHGSGSFGHFAAHKYGTASGVRTVEQWRGFAEVARIARRLSQLVADSLGEAGLPAWPLSPSASAVCSDGEIDILAIEPIRAALTHGLIPLVHGDVALDSVRGGTIASTETVFLYLAPVLRPQRIFLFGEVDGVLDATGQVIRRISPSQLPELERLLGGSHGVDVTGGMESKVHDMLRLVQTVPGLRVHILSGLDPEQARIALIDPEAAPGTLITED